MDTLLVRQYNTMVQFVNKRPVTSHSAKDGEPLHTFAKQSSPNRFLSETGGV